MTSAQEVGYDEFQYLPLHAQWAGLAWDDPCVRRVRSGAVSGLQWGTSEPELVLLHGTGQNAHTWDTFALALGRSCLALDLPGHGHSDWREDGDYLPHATGPVVAAAIEQLAPAARLLVGMSLGGLTALRVATHQRVVLVDITPAPPELVPGLPVSLLSGPHHYPTWEALLDATHATMPHRDRDSLIPGLRHNTRRFEDGSWGWRYDRMRYDEDPRPRLAQLWAEVERHRPLLVCGALSRLVTPAAVDELQRRVPGARVEVVEGAGHAVQSDQPVALARLVGSLL